MAPQNLENTARMLQSRIPFGKTQPVALVEPALLVVGALLFVPAGEKAGRAFVRVAELFAQNAGGIGEVHHIIPKEKVDLDNMPDEYPQKREDHPQAESEKFSNEIIFFDIERGAAEMTDRGRVIYRHAVFFVDEGALA